MIEPLAVNDVEDNLAKADGGATVDDPVQLSVNINLAGDGWEALLAVIQTSGKYAALDLSACTMDGTEFDPGTDGAGADKITALTLPDAAKSIKPGTWEDPTFKAFASLESIRSAGVETVGAYAFYRRESLTSVSLPVATDIGDGAFSGASLVSVSLPAAKAIGGSSFSYCASLMSVSLPAADSIGAEAFASCAALESVSVGASLATIHARVFSGCSNLTAITVDPANPAFTARDGMLMDKAETTLIAYPSATGAITLPGIIDIGDGAFEYCASLTSVSLPAAQTIDNGSLSVRA